MWNEHRDVYPEPKVSGQRASVELDDLLSITMDTRGHQYQRYLHEHGWGKCHQRSSASNKKSNVIPYVWYRAPNTNFMVWSTYVAIPLSTYRIVPKECILQNECTLCSTNFSWGSIPYFAEKRHRVQRQKTSPYPCLISNTSSLCWKDELDWFSSFWDFKSRGRIYLRRCIYLAKYGN